MTTGEGEINAAASTMAFFLSPKFDLRKTYFLVAGIAGINPHTGTLGSAAFARYAIQAGQQYVFDARDKPDNWTFSFWQYGTTQPNLYPTETYGTEVFKLNTNLAQKAYEITKHVKLNDSSAAQEWRSKFDYAPANESPKVLLGDVMTSDIYFAGEWMGWTFGNLTTVLTNGTGTYATTAQEDNATLESLMRATKAGLADYGRIIVLRTASDIDRAPPNVEEYDSFEADQGGFEPSIQNLFIVGHPIVKQITENWHTWKYGIEPENGFYGDIFQTLRK